VRSYAGGYAEPRWRLDRRPAAGTTSLQRSTDAPPDEALAADAPSPVTCENPVAEEILAVDAVVSTLPLRPPGDHIRGVPIADLFVR